MGLSEPEHATFRALLAEVDARRDELTRQRGQIIDRFYAQHPGFHDLPSGERERLADA